MKICKSTNGVVRFSAALREEMQYLADTTADELDEGMDPGNAYTPADRLRQIAEDMSDRDHWSYNHRKEIRAILRDIGVDREITEDEISRTIVCGRKAWDYVYGGQKYVFDSWTPLEAARVYVDRIEWGQ